jgi:hypothetical protein
MSCSCLERTWVGEDPRATIKTGSDPSSQGRDDNGPCPSSPHFETTSNVHVHAEGESCKALAQLQLDQLPNDRTFGQAGSHFEAQWLNWGTLWSESR